MAYFGCKACHAVYEDYYPPGDTSTKCHSGTIQLVREADDKPSAFFYAKEATMTAITPELSLFISQEENSNGIHINSLILKHKGNHYHLPGGTNDTIHLFTESIALYVLSINEALGTMALNAFMAPEPDPINSVYLHTPKQIKDVLGAEWEQLPAVDVVLKLNDYLM